ncbi:MAG: Grx4 family monothiol glutaredoxin [Alphaproteobacteria bacterium]|nr:MAG: Grx4 family monothiol glutaredoxin [Alphaproteobacteria bacterium]
MLDESLKASIQEIITSHDVVLFMKGSAQFPMCGFSGYVVQALNRLRIPFHAVDVLQNSEIREGIKIFSDWPTIPQLYAKGEFIGGADIVREMFESEELSNYFAEKNITPVAA